MLKHLERSSVAYHVGRRLKSNSLRLAIASIAFGVAGNSAYNLVSRAINSTWVVENVYRGHVWIADLALLVAAVLGLALLKSLIDVFVRKVERAAVGEIQPDVKTVVSHSALIVFLSYPSGNAHEDALGHHLETGEGPFKLRYCWLVFTKESESVKNKVHADYSRTRYPGLRFFDAYLPSAYDALAAQGCVEKAIADARDVLKDNAETNELIVDITGGTKTMSIGAVLACVERGVAIEYMQSQYDENGKRVQKPSIAMLVETVPPQDLLVSSGG